MHDWPAASAGPLQPSHLRTSFVPTAATRWANREVESKAEADVVLGELKTAIRAGTFDERGLNPPPDRAR